MNQLKTPGVYVNEIDAFPASVVEVETAIPAFIGYTYKEDHDEPKVLRIKSLAEFEEAFGVPSPNTKLLTSKVTKDAAGNFDVTVTVEPKELPKNILYYAMQMFYDNGGGPCYIVSVGKAANNAVDKAKLKAGILKIQNYDEPTLLVIPEAVKTVTYNDQNKIDPATYTEIIGAAISQAEYLKDRFVIIDVPFNEKLKIKDDSENFRGESIGFATKYAAAYYPYVNTTLNYLIKKDENDPIDEFKFSDDSDAAYKTKPLKDFKGSAIYEKVKSEAEKKLRVVLPPSGIMAGVYSKVDAERGVWKAPANVVMKSVLGPTIPISLDEQMDLNVDPGKGRSINAIRYVTGVGLTVWGARTLNGNDRNWRYINVRRFFNMVEESVTKATLWAVFEPNTKNTWVKVKSMIESYLLTKWIEGALAGSKPEEAFFVNVGLPDTMTSDEVLDGIMRVRIGMAVSRPAEFIILEFTQKRQTS